MFVCFLVDKVLIYIFFINFFAFWHEILLVKVDLFWRIVGMSHEHNFIFVYDVITALLTFFKYNFLKIFEKRFSCFGILYFRIQSFHQFYYSRDLYTFFSLKLIGVNYLRLSTRSQP